MTVLRWVYDYHIMKLHPGYSVLCLGYNGRKDSGSLLGGVWLVSYQEHWTLIMTWICPVI